MSILCQHVVVIVALISQRRIVHKEELIRRADLNERPRNPCVRLVLSPVEVIEIGDSELDIGGEVGSVDAESSCSRRTLP